MSVTTIDDGPVRVLTLDDGKANALSPDVMSALSEELDRAEADAQVRSLVLAGRPGRFSAGFDLSIMQSGDWSAIVNLVADGGALVRKIYGLGLPVVAAANGHALAAGALLLLGCDVRLGADVEAKIGLNEVAIGMVLPGWAFTLCEARLSPRFTQRALLNARITKPADAVEVGFLDEVTPADDLMARALAEASTLATLDPAAYKASVAAYRGPTLALMDTQIATDRS